MTTHARRPLPLLPRVADGRPQALAVFQALLDAPPEG